jgi:hypothetical protein
MTYDDWDIRTEEDEQEFDAATRRAYHLAANRRRFLQAQEDRDTGMELDPLLFEEPPEEEV